MKRIEEIKIQVDRWPLHADDLKEHICTIICVAAFKSKPDQKDMVRMLSDAKEIFVNGNTVTVRV